MNYLGFFHNINKNNINRLSLVRNRDHFTRKTNVGGGGGGGWVAKAMMLRVCFVLRNIAHKSRGDMTVIIKCKYLEPISDVKVTRVFIWR